MTDSQTMTEEQLPIKKLTHYYYYLNYRPWQQITFSILANKLQGAIIKTLIKMLRDGMAL